MCNGESLRIVDSRDHGTWRRRRRECTSCGHRWTTEEIPLGEAGTLLKMKALAMKMRDT